MKFLTNIQSEVARLDRIVTELLKLSRIEAHPAGTKLQRATLAQRCRKLPKCTGGELWIWV
jgi:hypothetical protein